MESLGFCICGKALSVSWWWCPIGYYLPRGDADQEMSTEMSR